MTPERWQRICDVFHESRRCDPQDRDTLLHEACGEDTELRAEVERLLADDAGASRDGFLDLPTDSVKPIDSAVSDGPILEQSGDRVGPYKILQALGEGGMGVVFLAEQDHPVRRRVALKLIKPGMDSRQVIARFAAERQALALMDHPNIARVLDAGATDAGRPYFVMELVKGVPITEYCDRNKLTTWQRLELFIAVCRAIQHAHQKGVIHRDIKPSNVLVTLLDGQPVPKVIDFGVAKAIDQRLTEQTIFTQFGAIVGTPEYMSPEQAGLSALDIDTRSDVYSLGVLLYELLTGTTPLDRQRLRDAGYAEIARLILDEETPRPSTRLSHSGTRLPAIAERRGVEPSRLTKLVRGELDWIAMKCLEKDRSRRYETANGLARDVERCLAGEAVEAGPPSAWYQLGKLARRHRATLAMAAAFAGLLVAAAAGGTYLAVRAGHAEAEMKRALDEAKAAQAKTDAALEESQEARSQAEAVGEFLVEALRSHTPDQDNETVTVAAVLDRAAAKLGDGFVGSQRVQGALLDALGGVYSSLRLRDKAIRSLARAVTVRRAALGDGHPDTHQSRHSLAAVYEDAGRWAEAEPLRRAVIDDVRRMEGPDSRALNSAVAALGENLVHQEKFAEAEPLLRECLNIRRDKSPDGWPQFVTMSYLGASLLGQRRYAEAEPLLLDGYDGLRLRKAELKGHLSRFLAEAENRVVALYQAWDKPDLARAWEAKLRPPVHPDSFANRLNRAYADESKGRWVEAEAFRRAILTDARRTEKRESQAMDNALAALGENLVHQGKFVEAEPLLRECLDIRHNKDPNGWLQFVTMSCLGVSLVGQRRFDEAELLLLGGYDGLQLRRADLKGDSAVYLTDAGNRLVTLYQAWGKPDWARAWEAKLRPPDHPDSFASRLNRAYDDESKGRWTEAERLRRAILDERRRTEEPGSVAVGDTLAALGENLVQQRRFGDAEPVLRECLEIRGTTYANSWPRFATMSYLGASLLGQRRYAEAEPLLLDGYDGLRLRKSELTDTWSRQFLAEAENRVVALYQAWGKPAQARAWEAKLGLADLPGDVFAPPATVGTGAP